MGIASKKYNDKQWIFPCKGGKMKKINQKWTDAELQIVKDNYHLGLAKVQTLLPYRSKSSIVSKAQAFGLTNGANHWLESEEDLLKKYYIDLGAKGMIGMLPNHTLKAIRARANKLGLRQSNVWTKDEIKILKDNFYELGAKGVAKIIPTRSVKTIACKATQLGLTYKDGSFAWGYEDLETLINNYYEFGPKKMCTLIPNHPKSSIVAKARKLGLVYKNRNSLWTDEEVGILKQFYPTEGTKVCKRLPNRSKEMIIGKARCLGIKYDKTIIEWPVEEDELIYDFYMTYREKSFYRLAEILNILAQHGFTKHGTTTIKMRLQNYSYLDKGVGLSHAAKQSRLVFDRYQA